MLQVQPMVLEPNALPYYRTDLCDLRNIVQALQFVKFNVKILTLYLEGFGLRNISVYNLFPLLARP
jgi:hypothetical protein